MTAEQFVYWINGFLEIGNPSKLDENNIKVIRDHLALVIKKQTPDRNEKATQIQSEIPIFNVATILTC